MKKINKQKYTWDKSKGILKQDFVSHIIINGKYHKQTKKWKNKKKYKQTQKWEKPSTNLEMEKLLANLEMEKTINKPRNGKNYKQTQKSRAQSTKTK